MAKTHPSSADDSSLEPIKFKTWVLKVHIHCEGCRKTVKKVLRSIEGVYKTEIDSQQHKATVIGSVEFHTLIKKLAKIGKHAELWGTPSTLEENPNNNEQNSSKKSKKKTQKTLQNAENKASESNDDARKPLPEPKISDRLAKKQNQEKNDPPKQKNSGKASPANDHPPPATVADGGGGDKNKRKNKGQTGNSVNNNNTNYPFDKSSPILPKLASESVNYSLVNPHGFNQFGQYYPPQQQQPAGYAASEYGLSSYNATYPSTIFNSPSFYSPPTPMHFHAHYFGTPRHPLPPPLPLPSDFIKPINDVGDDYYDDKYSSCMMM